MIDELRCRIVRAQGGENRWSETDRLLATFSMGGSEFLTHFQPHPFQDVEVTLAVAQFRLSLAPFPRPGCVGVFEPCCVRIETDDGELVEERTAPGSASRSLRHWMFWDSLDLIYIAGVRLWHALLLPRLLMRTGVACERLPEVTVDGERWERVEVRFPVDIPLPSHQQVLYLDSRDQVRRMDYAPTAYGGMLRVGHLMSDYESFGGLLVPTRHEIFPCVVGSQLWRGTRLAWFNVDDVTAMPETASDSDSGPSTGEP